ncbi:AsmA-like C-terminal domain-containing protein [Nitrosophilus kaiyonis]|uniref:YhdP family protein n=1 Tax=Nitrosophilus kaiyonis TaxID=2930200 RepID=UPI002491BAED|nr:AsmA-like C-terminal domain-containing protein [Nitrosophilus kaiyonis]
MYLPKIYIKGLYLKLDKKLILNIENIKIEREKRKNRKKDIENYIRSFKYLPLLFQNINVQKIDFLNYHVTFLYTDDIYFIDTDSYQLAAKLKLKDHKIYAYIPNFLHKNFNFNTTGNAIFDLRTGFVSYRGKYDIDNIKGDIYIKYKNDKIDFLVKSRYFKNENLKKITDRFHLNKDISDWIYKKIVAKRYILKFLKGEIDLNSKKIYDPKKIEGLATAYNAQIEFNKKAKKVKCKKIDVVFKNDSLYFKLHTPKYENIDLSGSFVVIKNLIYGKSYIDIIIKTKTKIDNEIKSLLLAYNINLPLYQKSGETRAIVKINVDFKNFNVDVSGDFYTQNSVLNISDFDLIIKNAHLKLKNSTLSIIDSQLAISNIVSANAKGKIFFDKKEAKLILTNLNIYQKFNSFELIKAQNLNEKLYLDFKQDNFTQLSFENLNSVIKIYKDKSFEIVLKDLSKIKNYSPILKKADIKKGKLNIKTKDFNSFLIDGELEKPNKILFDKKGKSVTFFKIKGKIEKNNTKIVINDKIKFLYSQIPKIYIYSYDIYLNKNILKTDKKDSSRFFIFGKNSNIIIDNHKILSNRFTFKNFEKRFEFENIYKKSLIKAYGNIDYFSISAKKLNDEFVKTFLNIYGIIGGVYNLEAKGNLNNLSGKVKFYNATLKDLALINNIMAFLNTIPALVTFSDPGYSTKGLKIKKGEIKFRLKKDMLYIDDLKFNGKSVNIEGVGIINLKENTINMILKLQTLKKVTDIIKKIPIAGYIILGKEGKISTVLKLEGDLIKPKISTKLPEETIKAPINIIKRTLQLPFKIFK